MTNKSSHSISFMDRVETLLLKLQDQFSKKSSAGDMLITAQLLQQELIAVKNSQPVETNPTIVVSMPLQTPAIEMPIPVETTEQPTYVTPKVEVVAAKEEEKIIEVLQVDEAEIEAELEEMKKNAVVIQQMSTKSKPQILFELEEEEIPTLALQTAPVKDNAQPAVASEDHNTLNDILKEKKVELGEKLNDEAIKDLKKAIGINDRFLFINDLFRGDEAMYERSIKTINSFDTWPEAEYWIRRELKTKLGWVDDDKTVQEFDHLIKRRFSRM